MDVGRWGLVKFLGNHSFHSKNPINSLKIRKKLEKNQKKSEKRKLGKVLEEGSIVYCRLLEKRSIGGYR